MRRFVLALAVVLLACKHPGSAKLEGRWKGVRAEGVGPESAGAANVFAQGTEIIARGDTLTMTTPVAKGLQDTYVVDEETKTTLVLHTRKDGASTKETFGFSDDLKTMTWRLGDGRAIVFQRVKP